MHVCVLGAGVIGVTTAWMLARRGWQVTLVDAEPAAARGASHANGGQLSYSYVAPLAAPDVFCNLPGWLLRGDSPLRLRPRLDPDQWRWSLQFALACTRNQARDTTTALSALAELSRQSLDALLADTPIDFSHRRNGKLIVYRSHDLLEKARAQVDYQATLGARQQILGAEDCIALEPALAPLRGRFAGAVYTPTEEAGDCRLFTENLCAQLAELPNVTLRLASRIERLARRSDGSTYLVLANGDDLTADAYVLAAGMGSKPLYTSLGGTLPLYPLKGYSLTVPLEGDLSLAPDISVTDYERRIVYARLDTTLRIAAMVDIGDTHPGVSTGRLVQLKRQVHELLPSLPLDQATAWAGQRPATPHGRPLIGRSRRATDVWLNLGHGALGFTLACGSAALLGQLLAGETPSIDTRPFIPTV